MYKETVRSKECKDVDRCIDSKEDLK